MITIAFRKFGNGVYIAHTDILRSLNRVFRRAGVDVNYSKGFNRHMSLKLTQPLPFAVASDEEWVTADIDGDYNAEQIIRLFNESCPPFLQATEAYITEKNPQLAGKIVASGYRVDCVTDKETALKIEGIKAGYVVNSVGKNGEAVVKRTDGLIYSVKADGEKIDFLLAFGNTNLRIDALTRQLNADFGLNIRLSDIVRTAQYARIGEDLVKVSDYMKNL